MTTDTGPMATAPTFRAVLTRDLRRGGFDGEWADVGVADGRLTISGEKGGRLVLTPSEIERMRVGFEESKYGRLYEWRLWHRGERVRTLALTPIQRGRPEYGATVRAFARVMADAGALGRIEAGGSKFSALLPPTLFGGLFVAASGLSIAALGHEPWWGRLLVPLAPGLLLAYSLHMTTTRHWPRPITRIEELDRQVG